MEEKESLIASVREECEKEINYWKRDVYGENANEISWLSKEIKRLQKTLSRYSNQEVVITNQQSEIERLKAENERLKSAIVKAEARANENGDVTTKKERT